jgi:hypothetical protein
MQSQEPWYTKQLRESQGGVGISDAALSGSGGGSYRPDMYQYGGDTLMGALVPMQRRILSPETQSREFIGFDESGVPQYDIVQIPAQLGQPERGPGLARRAVGMVRNLASDPAALLGGIGDAIQGQSRAATAGGQYFDEASGRLVEFDPLTAFVGGAPAGISAVARALPGEVMLGSFGSAMKEYPRSVVPNVAVGQTISERFPTAVKATENPLTGMLRVDMEALSRSPDQVSKLAETVQPYTPTMGLTSPEQILDTMKNTSVENLRFIYDQMPPQIRQEAKLWYEGANRLANESASRYGISREAAAGVYASLSPQKDWYQNVSLGDRIFDIYFNNSSLPFNDDLYRVGLSKLKNPDHLAALKNIRNKPLAAITDPVERAIWVRMFDEANNPRAFSIVSPRGERLGSQTVSGGDDRKVAWGSFNEIQKALSVLENPSIENISTQMGLQHKVRNFYNNIVNPFDPLSITADTHAVAAALMQPLGGSAAPVAHNLGGAASSALTGVRGTYPIYADAYRDFASQTGILPREAQSIAWEGVRGLFSPEQKRNKGLVDIVNRLMLEQRQGNMTQRQMQDAILNEAGGISVPDWAR